MSSAMTTLERSTLAECEAVVERGMESFIEVGNALLRIRNERLYRAEFGTFQEYCEAKWKISRPQAYRMIDAAEVAGNLSPIGDKPTSESVLRPLVQLSRKQQRTVWKAAVEASPNGKPTAKQVEATVEVIAPPPKSRVNYTLSNGLHYAQLAIDNLKQIPPNDTQRTEAFQAVKRWIEKQESLSPPFSDSQ